jgi:integrase/recombinase XerD
LNSSLPPQSERDAFLRAAEQATRPVRTLRITLAYSGCLWSEALALTADRVEPAADLLVFETLKKRRSGLYCGVPVPPALLEGALRHGFSVAAVSAGIPLNLMQKWLGQAQLSTTAIYADAVGTEEKDIAQRM